MVVLFLSMKNEFSGRRSVFHQGGGTDADAGKSARRNGINAARVPRPAFHQPAKREAQADKQAVLVQRLARIVRAGGREAAAAGWVQRGQRRRHGLLVNPEEPARGAGGKGKSPRYCHSERSEESTGCRVRGKWILRVAQDDTLAGISHSLLGVSLRHASAKRCSTSGNSSRRRAARAVSTRSRPKGTRAWCLR